MKQAYSDETILKLKEYYLENEVSFKTLSNYSKQLCGLDVSIDDIKMFSRDDAYGPWGVTKANSGRRVEDVPVREKLKLVADKLYSMIIDPEGNIPSNQIAQTAKAWADMVEKAKLSELDGGTAKLTSQQAKDIIAKQQAKNA